MQLCPDESKRKVCPIRRRAALVLQRRWRERYAHRSRAAVAVQVHVRGWLAARQLLQARRAASIIAVC